MRISVTQTPQDALALASIAPGSTVQIQNQGTTAVRIYAGASAPASLDDYFVHPGGGWYEYIGNVVMVYSGQPTYLHIQDAT